jgi:hypothetical protein
MHNSSRHSALRLEPVAYTWLLVYVTRACAAGCVITAFILGSGFSQFKAGNKKASQFFMRARVLAQVSTLG